MGKKGNKGKVPLGDLSTFEFQPPDAVHGPPREPVRPLRVEAFQADLGRAGVFEIGELSSATTVQELTRHIEAEHNGAVLNLRVFMDVAMEGRLLNDGAETLGAALQRFHGEGNRTMLVRDADEGVLSVAYDFDSMAGCPLLLKQPELLSPSHGGSPDSESPRGKAGTPTGGTPGGPTSRRPGGGPSTSSNRGRPRPRPARRRAHRGPMTSGEPQPAPSFLPYDSEIGITTSGPRRLRSGP